MNTELLTIDSPRWRDILMRLPHDTYHLQAYAKVSARTDGGEACAFAWEDEGGGCFLAPFILRRLKSDPSIIQDLPPKNEMNVVCTLTREQATLYKAVVDEELRRIEEAEGIERRGRVLALLMFTKQICNHPAQYLGESGPLANR